MEESQRIELCQAFLPVSVFGTVADHSALLSIKNLAEGRGFEPLRDSHPDFRLANEYVTGFRQPSKLVAQTKRGA